MKLIHFICIRDNWGWGTKKAANRKKVLARLNAGHWGQYDQCKDIFIWKYLFFAQSRKKGKKINELLLVLISSNCCPKCNYTETHGEGDQNMLNCSHALKHPRCFRGNTTPLLLEPRQMEWRHEWAQIITRDISFLFRLVSIHFLDCEHSLWSAAILLNKEDSDFCMNPYELQTMKSILDFFTLFVLAPISVGLHWVVSEYSPRNVYFGRSHNSQWVGLGYIHWDRVTNISLMIYWCALTYGALTLLDSLTSR